MRQKYCLLDQIQLNDFMYFKLIPLQNELFLSFLYCKPSTIKVGCFFVNFELNKLPIKFINQQKLFVIVLRTQEVCHFLPVLLLFDKVVWPSCKVSSFFGFWSSSPSSY